jgi:CheY-like chemotaxis protein
LARNGSFRILVAEDDDDLRTALEALLIADGRFTVSGARDGKECVELAERLDVDAVVIDIEMPVLDGVEATRMLLDAEPSLPVVAISGNDYEERVLEIRAAGARDYVRKARIDDDLLAVLESLLDT